MAKDVPYFTGTTCAFKLHPALKIRKVQKMRVEEKVLDIFKVMVVDETAKTGINTELSGNGVVLDFSPTDEQREVLLGFYKPLDMTTLFTRQERETSDPFDLISKQIFHYIEVYGLKAPGLFNLEVNDGELVTMNFITGVTVDELQDMVRTILYRNAPFKNSTDLKDIIDHYVVNFDINSVLNNELKVLLFDPAIHTFTNGDDVVRWICRESMKSVNPSVKDAMLIKSLEMINTVKRNSPNVKPSFLERHALPLAQVFNRHKKLIMALKNEDNRSVINRISKMSKSNHVPIRESVNKSFVAKALAETIDMNVLDNISIRDKFKFLNLLEYKMLKRTTDAFVIRNGKVHLHENRRVWKKKDIKRVMNAVLESLKKDLTGNLAGKKILLDSSVHYGLPISRKQALGNLPFGTKIVADRKNKKKNGISSGIYWENSWGATDLDLSSIDTDGKRTGWGGYAGYDRNNDIAFSGDLTSARDGAMEFMTSRNSEYGLFVNIYSGQVGCGMEIVVGDDDGNKKHWIENPIIREKINLDSRNMLLGFVRNSEYVVWTGRIGGGRVSKSEGNLPYMARGLSEMWTVNSLLDHLGIEFDTVRDDEVEYDFDLTYEGFSLDKLEELVL